MIDTIQLRKGIKKADLTIENTFVDARGAKKYKLYLNPALAEAGVNRPVRG